MSALVETPRALDGHCLHNCGPGTREVFRTPVLGTPIGFDVRRVLLGRRGRGRTALPLGKWATEKGPAPAGLVLSAARLALAELGAVTPACGGRSDPEQARANLSLLAEHLLAIGALVDMVGLADHAVTTVGKGRGRVTRPSTLELATTLVVYAVYAPPLLVWARAPSLRWFRGDTVITLRRFGAGGAR